MRNYRNGFVVALLGNLVLAGIIGGWWWHSRRVRSQQKAAAESSASNTSSNISSNPASSPAMATAPAASAAVMPPPAEAALAPVQISPQRLQGIGVQMGTVQRKTVEDEIRTTGTVAMDETRLAYVQVRFPGYIQKVFANATYQYVRKGQPLFTMYSPDLVATEREYLVAKHNRQQLAQSTVEGVAEGAASLLDAAAARLQQWGVPQTEIARLESSGKVQQELEVDSPVAGYITERNALPNLTVQPETRLYTIADLSSVWVLAQVFQNDLGRVRIGAPVSLTVDAYPGRTFSGRVDFVYPDVDMTTRTARVRLILANPGMKLSPGMFVNAELKVPMGLQLVVAASGVLQSGTRVIVFVDRGDGYLDPREVQLGARVGDDFIVLKGLKAGEHIVTSANFLIDSESQLQAAMGSFAPPPPVAGGASATNVPQANIELITEPNPPRKGSNIIRVKITDAKGAPVSGAEVSVTFSMPAMPSMGMAAMHTAVTLSDKGNGAYEGSGQLDGGGTWQVTILAKKNGQTVGTKQMSVTVEGGM